MVNYNDGDGNRDDRRRATDTLVDKEDLRELKQEIREGFAGVHARQDKTNGRLGEVEVVQAFHKATMEGMQRDIQTQHRRHESRRTVDPPPEDGPKSPVTQREVRLVLSTLGASVGLLKLLPWLFSLVK